MISSHYTFFIISTAYFFNKTETKIIFHSPFSPFSSSFILKKINFDGNIGVNNFLHFFTNILMQMTDLT